MFKHKDNLDKEMKKADKIFFGVYEYLQEKLDI